ncbi:hypothetical protein BDY17DRAFT_245200 [Neohortaea acidophila]|uniref:Iron-sulfur cluster assembly factor IBA57 homolog, mitochondrial n=1 Tax=Neohortaea acidophila TaxID=245834 RepID=A0A6A6Q446_9PEZI|nr:uncharacterized protein BDY17DRAFT_245200 [Neohortaea acidophila]KAF2486167.1 hypothetical protein BDY17DRAFT_245200 [Neohortaea acidophila]
MSIPRSIRQTSTICARCLRQYGIRSYSTSAGRNPPPPPPPPSGAARLSNRRLLSIHGQDAAKFLQGLITANVRPESRTGFYTAFLNAQGKVLNDAFVYPTLGSKWHDANTASDELGYLLEVDGEQAETLLKHLKRHKLRSKLKLRLLEEGELSVWSVWKEDERWTAHTKAEDGSGAIGMTDSRAPGMGQRILLPSQNSKDDLQEFLDGVPEAPMTAYTLRRYLKGVAEGQVEIPREESLPMNCNIDIMGGIDFKKGCYVGQELTIRTHHTGVVRRRILPVVLHDHAQAPPERVEYVPDAFDEVLEKDADIRRDDKRKRPTGKFLAGIGNVGLAMCRLEQMSDLKVSGEASSFDGGDRFIVQSSDGRELGIKAVVPDWLRGKIREPKIQKRVG